MIWIVFVACVLTVLDIALMFRTWKRLLQMVDQPIDMRRLDLGILAYLLAHVMVMALLVVVR